MFRSPIHDVAWIVATFAFGLGCEMPRMARGGLSGPPQSYVVPTGDGTHMLVMLSATPIADDKGADCTLPDGRQVNLRETFPTSGLYKIGSTEPVWKAAWYGEKRLTRISADGRFALYINRFGGGGWGEGVKPRWGIKFYDNGVEIKTYDVVELVDYPSLMEFTSADWHCLWIDTSVYDAQIEDRLFMLKTSTRETYRFDISTGKIVEEHRFWRHVARGSVLALVLFGFAGVWLWYRGRVAARERSIEKIFATDVGDGQRTAGNWRTDRLRSLFVLTTVAGICCAYPHIGVLLSALGIAVFCTLKLSGVGRRGESGFVIRPAARWRSCWWVLSLASWFLFYALSFGPAFGLALYCRWPHDVRGVLLQVVYAPVSWLLFHTSVREWRLVQMYLQAWGAS